MNTYIYIYKYIYIYFYHVYHVYHVYISHVCLSLYISLIIGNYLSKVS